MSEIRKYKILYFYKDLKNPDDRGYSERVLDAYTAEDARTRFAITRIIPEKKEKLILIRDISPVEIKEKLNLDDDFIDEIASENKMKNLLIWYYRWLTTGHKG